MYAIPGFIGFYLFTNNNIPTEFIYISFAYTTAMHLFSAVPDINSDKKANLKTTAVTLGERVSLLICLILWFSISIILIRLNILIFFVSLIYSILVFLVLFKFRKVDRVYWVPYINTIVGFLSFWKIIFIRFI